MKPVATKKKTSNTGRSSAAAGKDRSRARGEETMDIAGVQITRATKVLYPDQGVTKGDLARYYEAVAGRMLPHIAKRPLMILRCPEGHQKPCFHQKHVTDTVSSHIKSVSIKEGGKTTKTLMVDDLAGLIALVQMGTLEVHAWGSRAERLEYPDRLIFDLDPDAGLPWRRVVEAARLLKDRLEDLGLKSWVKTTGGKGLHVVAPLEPRQDWTTVKSFARAFAESVVRHAPDRYTSNMAKAQRKSKIFIDYLRNGRGATAVATYSTRARPGAPVSWPIEWKELGRTDPKKFTLRTIGRRLSSIKADPWKGFDTTRQSLTQTMLRKMGIT
jgi:bifunctional non-homologous end joining protein LigD